ncbi:uncharacterized protein PAC_11631 [Phialocephala subalpina]|uniref:2EXR domain-containing protein n=1 Tax=Phialocephala subalpina TaxID=576137 RepID=A0A1L7X9N4_9HELO|nr:uncharacterized protein PAC_11631 [Phialocephala subalpina]
MSDPASLLADGLSSFGFSNPDNREQERFTMFPELPTELRLKIWRHALPNPSVIRLTAHILVSDPAFGFYLTFFMTVDGKVTLVTHVNSFQRRRVELNQNDQRALPLLRACKESREIYLENFSIALPYDLRGTGTLYISKKEILHLSNFSDLIHHRLFHRALDRDDRLQTWYFTPSLLSSTSEAKFFQGKDWDYMPLLCQRMPNLKELKGVMWDRFQDVIDNGNAEGTNTIKNAMNAQLRNAELELSRYRDEHDETLVVPEIALMI